MSITPTMSQRVKHLPVNSPLAQLFSRHDDSCRNGFITRLDRSPISSKVFTFLKGLVLNLGIVAFVGYLAYITIVRDLLSSMPESVGLSLCITQDLLIFWAILILLRSTSVPFFFGECRLRILYGFRPTEIVIRKPPSSTSLPSKNLSEDQRLERYWRLATRAVNPRLLYSNPGAILSSNYWVLEYSTVLDTYKCLEKGEFQVEDLEFSFWKQEGRSWSVCELWRMHEIMNDQQEVVMFKTFLTKEGKKELFSIWQNMVPNLDSKSTTGHVRSPSEQKAYQAMVDSFAREGLDYEAIWSRISEQDQPSRLT
ncbi:hypothetical protein BDQ12DRAFT_681609 [Crucibulum laeve]|uniref:Uncharacterized protein n=1 Tax=Crucibulum laeve TaxID=68775 RepID=A0A5C3M462_9AGAR|nr:hypothetical protein BDQ12DRAFT_681609 [Crucibulum laeve]